MRRVVVTGLGIIAPNGQNKETYWENTKNGVSFVSSDPEMKELGFKSSVLCRIAHFDISSHVNVADYPELSTLDNFVQYGVAAGEQAIKDAKLEGLTAQYSEEMGIIFSSAIGGTPTIVKIFSELTESGKTGLQYKPVGSRFYNSGMFNYPAMLLANKYQLSGPCTSVTTGCTAGLDALGVCFDLIRTGEATVMLAGASEAPLTPLTYATLDVINSLAIFDGDPAKSSRPFDLKRSGFVISEGAVVFVLEELESALSRNATIYAEVKAFASVSNAFHMTDLPANGLPMAEAVSRAITLSGLEPTEIGYINAHGSSTPQNDVFETAAYKAVFKDHAYKIPVSSVKSMIGHSLASASLMGAMCVVGAIRNHVIPPTINYEFPDPECDLDYVPNVARQVHINAGMVTASGFGGIHSVAILTRYE